MSNPDLEIEVIGNEIATANPVVSSTLELEVNLQSVSLTGTVTGVPEVVEITFPGPVMLPDGTAVKNEGNAPGIIVLEAADPVPGGLPVGTIILRK